MEVLINKYEAFDYRYSSIIILEYVKLLGKSVTVYVHSLDFNDEKRPSPILRRSGDVENRRFVSRRGAIYMWEDKGDVIPLMGGYRADDVFDNSSLERTDPTLLQAVRNLRLVEDGIVKIVDIPDDIEWYVESDEIGIESIHEEHRVWD